MEKVPAIRCPHPYPLECTTGHISVLNSTNLLDCPHLAPSEHSGSGGTVDNELQEPPQHPDTCRNIPGISQMHSGILIHNDSASSQIHATTHSLYICTVHLHYTPVLYICSIDLHYISLLYICILHHCFVNYIYIFCSYVKYFYICSNVNSFRKLYSCFRYLQNRF